MGKSTKLINCELTSDEFEVLKKIRDTKYGTVEVYIKNRNITQFDCRATYKPSSLEGAQ